jgi:hypothetical protein
MMPSNVMVLAVLLMLMEFGAVTGQVGLAANQTASEAAANMTDVLRNMPNIISAYVQIKPDLCTFEVIAPWGESKMNSGDVTKVIAGLYGTYLQQHQDYLGNLTLNMSTYADGLVMTEMITNADARANYAGIDYVMIKSLDIIKLPVIYDPRSEGIRTPIGY